MKNDIETDDQINRLKYEPSVSGWELFIKELINGKYEYLVVKIGGIEEIIEKTISESNDASIARHTFKQALRIVVQEWQPGIIDPLENITAYLNLIGSYTPAEGYNKIIFLLQKWGIERIEDAPYRQKRLFTSIFLKSINVLRRYFPAAPQPDENIPSFQAYVNILWQYLRNKNLREYAICRLFDLHIVHRNIDKLTEVIFGMPDIVYDFVSIIINRKENTRENLSIMFGICFIEAKLQKIFYDSLGKKGAKENEGQAGPEITLQNGVIVKIELSDEQRYLYMSKKWRKDGEQLRKMTATILEASQCIS